MTFSSRVCCANLPQCTFTVGKNVTSVNKSGVPGLGKSNPVPAVPTWSSLLPSPDPESRAGYGVLWVRVYWGKWNGTTGSAQGGSQSRTVLLRAPHILLPRSGGRVRGLNGWQTGRLDIRWAVTISCVVAQRWACWVEECAVGGLQGMPGRFGYRCQHTHMHTLGRWVEIFNAKLQPNQVLMPDRLCRLTRR